MNSFETNLSMSIFYPLGRPAFAKEIFEGVSIRKAVMKVLRPAKKVWGQPAREMMTVDNNHGTGTDTALDKQKPVSLLL